MEGSSGSASAVTEHESDVELLSVTSGSKAFTNWILDIGCTFHMCAVREWFDTYKEVSSGEVLMGDDSSCPVRGIGTVRIRMFDGMIRALGNVRYVPRLRKNLISLCTLDKASYGYKSKKGRLRKKSKVFAKFKEWKTETKNQTRRNIKYLRSDNGGEYISNEFTDYCKQKGIIRHFTIKKNPQQNGVAERMN
ncbi:hypothetical protein TB1_013986 [Malus domestica]